MPASPWRGGFTLTCGSIIPSGPHGGDVLPIVKEPGVALYLRSGRFLEGMGVYDPDTR